MEIHNQWFVFYVAPMLLNFVAIIWTVCEFNSDTVQTLIRENRKAFEEVYGPIELFRSFMLFLVAISLVPIANILLLFYHAYVTCIVVFEFFFKKD